jgi:acyl-CoA dehydrogenase
MRDILEDSINRMLTDWVTPELLKEAELGAWPGELWRLIAESGFPLALVGETKGGAGLNWSDAYPLAFAAGRHALPLPLPETLLAAWLLDAAGVEVPPVVLTIADAGEARPVRAMRIQNGWHLFGELVHVPWGRSASYAVVEVALNDAPHIALIALDAIAKREDLNIAREPRDRLTLDGALALALAPLPAAVSARPIRLYGAMLRSAQMAGAMERLVEQCVRYAGERIQFGKPIGKFQAIQQQVAVLGCESAAAGAGAAFAFEQAGTAAAQFAIAAAKVRAGEAAGKAAAIAHAVHGALGFTYEHTLHFATRRLWSWRGEFGHHAWWSRRLGAAICGNGDRLWPTITDGRLPIFDTNRTSSLESA